MKPPRIWDEERSSPWLLALYAAAFCAATLPAHKTEAAELVLHLGSAHSHAGYNNTNPGAGLRLDNGIAFGAYRNSYRRSTVYAVWQPDWPLGDTGLRAGFFIGAATGYRVATGHAVSPMAAITLRWGPVQLLAIPAISPKHASVIHAALVFQL